MLPYLGVRYQIKYHRCNLTCPYCIASWQQQKNEFDDTSFIAITDRLRRLPFSISLRIGVGGEIFTSPRLMEGIKRICNTRSNITNVSFSTNLVADWDNTIAPFLSSLETGKLGVGCTLHDTVIDDRDEFFRKAHKLKESGAAVYVGLVAVPGRFSHIRAYKEKCASLGIRLILNGLIGKPAGATVENPGLDYPGAYTLREVEELKELWDTPHSFKLLVESCATTGMRCSAGKNYIYIDHHGNVFPCQGIPNPLGNILTDEIRLQPEDTICPRRVCWCGNENQALRIVDEYYDRSNTLRLFTPKKTVPPERLYDGYQPSIFQRVK